MRQAKKEPTSTEAEATADEILPEYDFSRSRPNPYAARYEKGSLVVTLDPDVAAVFSSAGEANDALRPIARIIRTQQDRRAKKGRALNPQPTG